MVAGKPETTLRTRAMQYLARREHSRAELRAKLAQHVQAGDDLDAVLDALAARGWLSDARAADQLVNQRRGRVGFQRIAHEMRQKGLSEDLIAAAAPGLKEGELSAVRAVWQKKFGATPKNAKEKSRQMRFLQSRGFSMDAILKAMKFADMDE